MSLKMFTEQTDYAGNHPADERRSSRHKLSYSVTIKIYIITHWIGLEKANMNYCSILPSHSTGSSYSDPAEPPALDNHYLSGV